MLCDGGGCVVWCSSLTPQCTLCLPCPCFTVCARSIESLLREAGITSMRRVRRLAARVHTTEGLDSLKRVGLTIGDHQDLLDCVAQLDVGRSE